MQDSFEQLRRLLVSNQQVNGITVRQYFAELHHQSLHMRDIRRALQVLDPSLNSEALRVITVLMRYLYYDRMLQEYDAKNPEAPLELGPGRRQLPREKRLLLKSVVKFRGELFEFTLKVDPSAAMAFWRMVKAMGPILEQHTHFLRRSITAEVAVMIAADKYQMMPRPSSTGEDLYFAIDLWLYEKAVAIQVTTGPKTLCFSHGSELPDEYDGIHSFTWRALIAKFKKFHFRVRRSQDTTGYPQLAYLIILGEDGFDSHSAEPSDILKAIMKQIRNEHNQARYSLTKTRAHRAQ